MNSSFVRPARSEVTVAVTGLHRGENPQPGSAVVRSLLRAYPGLRIVGLAYDPLESGLFTSHAPASAYLIPYPADGADAFRSRVEEICVAERVRAILPCLDAEMPLLIESAAALASQGVASFLPTAEAFTAREKDRLAGAAELAGCAVPETVAVQDPAELHGAARRLGWPVFVKGRFYEARLASAPAELESAFWHMMNMWGSPVLLQRRIEGEEFDVVGVGDGEGGILGSCAIRKMLVTERGKGYAGVVVDSPRLDEAAAALVRALRWRGPFELEFIKPRSKRGGLYLIEFNPRFPSWVDFPSSLGCNLPALVLERMLEWPHRLPILPCCPGKFFIRHCVDLTGDIRDLASLTLNGRLHRERRGSRGAAASAATPPERLAN